MRLNLEKQNKKSTQSNYLYIEIFIDGENTKKHNSLNLTHNLNTQVGLIKLPKHFIQIGVNVKLNLLSLKNLI